MKRFLLLLQVAALCCAALCSTAHSAEPKQFPRGAKPSPRHKILEAPQHKPAADVPAQIARIPATNSAFGNDQYGDCVTAEEAFSKDCDGILLPTQVVVDWATSHGFRDGADLISVMEAMATDGFPGPAGQRYDDGPYASVAYGDENTLRSAIAQGNVKIAIDANALPATGGNQQGWYVVGGGNWPNIDHCVSICGYGAAEYLYTQLQVAMPPALAGTSGYLVDTWGTIGFVDHPWLMSAMAGAGEAYVRNPTTVDVSPTPTPNPQPPSPAPHRLTFAELMQLLIARLHPHLTPGQAAAVADFFADDNSPRVRLLKWIVYRRLVRAGLIGEGDQLGSINWQELLKIVAELEPIIVPLIPLLFGEEPAERVRDSGFRIQERRSLLRPAVLLCSAPKFRKECGPNGCRRVPIESTEKVAPSPRPRVSVSPGLPRHQRTRRRGGIGTRR